VIITIINSTLIFVQVLTICQTKSKYYSSVVILLIYMFRLDPDGNCSLLCPPILPNKVPLTRPIASAGYVSTSVLVAFISTVVVKSPLLPLDVVPQELYSTTLACRHHLHLS